MLLKNSFAVINSYCLRFYYSNEWTNVIMLSLFGDPLHEFINMFFALLCEFKLMSISILNSALIYNYTQGGSHIVNGYHAIFKLHVSQAQSMQCKI